MAGEVTDVREMLAVHDALRSEYASLPLLVKSIEDDDRARAEVVAAHVVLLGRLTALHHAAEDDLLWPLVLERAGEPAAALALESEHDEMIQSLEQVSSLVEAWRADPSAPNRAALHTELIAFERRLLGHLAHEELSVLPLLAQHLSPEELGVLGTYLWDGLEPEQRGVVFNMIVDDTDDVRGEAFLSTLGEAARADVANGGRAEYRAYRSTLLDGWG